MHTADPSLHHDAFIFSNASLLDNTGSQYHVAIKLKLNIFQTVQALIKHRLNGAGNRINFYEICTRLMVSQ